jgi:hypothetical protein
MWLRILASALVAAAPATLSAQTYCVATSDSVSQVLLSSVRMYASSSDPVYAAARARNGIVLTAASNVTLVTDERVCQRISQSVSASALQSGYAPVNRVRAVKVGDMFIAQDPGVKWNQSDLTFYVTKPYKVTRRVGTT